MRACIFILYQNIHACVGLVGYWTSGIFETFIRNHKRLHGIVNTKRYRLNEIFLHYHQLITHVCKWSRHPSPVNMVANTDISSILHENSIQYYTIANCLTNIVFIQLESEPIYIYICEWTYYVKNMPRYILPYTPWHWSINLSDHDVTDGHTYNHTVLHSRRHRAPIEHDYTLF